MLAARIKRILFPRPYPGQARLPAKRGKADGPASGSASLRGVGSRLYEPEAKPVGLQAGFRLVEPTARREGRSYGSERTKKCLPPRHRHEGVSIRRYLKAEKPTREYDKFY